MPVHGHTNLLGSPGSTLSDCHAAVLSAAACSCAVHAQGDRKAGPSLSSYNYESVWGQQALKHMYRAVLEEEVPLVSIALC